MTTALLAYAVLAGVVIVEGLGIALGRICVPQRLAQLHVALRAFQSAKDDDTRQRLILQAGMRTLSLSLLLFFTLVVAFAVMALPLPWVAMDVSQGTAYMLALTVAALAWWQVRRRRASD